jgi:hypothetical protein
VDIIAIGFTLNVTISKRHYLIETPIFQGQVPIEMFLFKGFFMKKMAQIRQISKKKSFQITSFL